MNRLSVSRWGRARWALLAASVVVAGGTAVGGGAVAAQAVPAPAAGHASAATAYVTGDQGVAEIDTATGAVTRTDPMTFDHGLGRDPSNVAVTPDGTQLYVVDGTNGNISVVDTADDKSVDIFHVCTHIEIPSILFTPDGKQAYVDCVVGGSSTGGELVYAYAINTATHAVTQVTGVQTAEASVISPDGTELYVSDGTNVDVVDTATEAVTATIPTGTGADSLAVSRDGAQLYAGITNAVAVIDLATGTISGTLPFPDGASTQEFAVSADGTRLFVVIDCTVSVVDTSTDAVTETFPFTAPLCPLRVTAAPSGPMAYITADRLNGATPPTEIEAINTSTDAVTSRTPLGYQSPFLSVSPDGTRAYVGNVGYTGMAVLDTATGKVSATLDLTSLQGNIVFADQGKRAYAVSQGMSDGELWVINTATEKVITSLPSSKQQVGGIAVSPDGTKAYLDGQGAVMELDTATGATAGIALANDPSGIAFAPQGGKVYVADGADNLVHIIDPATNRLTGAFAVYDPAGVASAREPRALAFSPNGAELYVTDPISGKVSVVNPATDKVTATITVGAVPSALAVTPDGSKLYVTDLDSGNVAVVDTATNTVTGHITVLTSPSAVAITPDGTQAYVVDGGVTDKVSVIDTATGAVTATIAVGNSPVAVAITPDGTLAYVANSSSRTVSVIDTATNTVTSTIAGGGFGVAIGNCVRLR